MVVAVEEEEEKRIWGLGRGLEMEMVLSLRGRREKDGVRGILEGVNAAAMDLVVVVVVEERESSRDMLAEAVKAIAEKADFGEKEKKNHCLVSD